jgi:hypothetical protein
MAEFHVQLQARKPVNDKEASSRPGILTTIRPGTMQLISTVEAFVFTYFPNGMGNEQSGCQLLTGIEIKTPNLVNADEIQLLFKTTVDSFLEITDDARLHKIEKTIENVYNELHGDKPVKIESIQVVQHDPATDDLRYHVMQLECPTCHHKTKAVLSWDAVQARSNNPNPIANMFFKKDKTECGHSFIAFIDRALKVKGCDAIDM